MDILKKSGDYNIIINQNTDFQTNLGWEEGMNLFEEEVLDTIINPADNYETVRYIHEPYTFTTSGDTQCDIWFKFYFIDENISYNNGLDYSLIGISPKENALMTKQTTSSFFRLEFFKTPNDQPPTRLNRKFVFARNLSLPVGEKFYYTTLKQNIHVPVFIGSNYKNKENMYLFWFQDDSVLSDSTLSGNTFYMTAKFYNGVDGSIVDFTNSRLLTTTEVLESADLYYKVVIKNDYTYKIYNYDGEQNERIGHGLSNSINFYEKGGEIVPPPTPTSTQTPTPSVTTTHGLSATPTPTPTPTHSGPLTGTNYYYVLGDCDSLKYNYTGYSYNSITGYIVLDMGCATSLVIGQKINQYIGIRTYYVDYDNPCGFDMTSYIGRSTTQLSISNGDVVKVSSNGNNICYPAIYSGTTNRTYDYELDGVETFSGTNPCGDCQVSQITPNVFKFYEYSATKCSDGSGLFIYSIFEYISNSIFSYNAGDVVKVIVHDVNGNEVDEFCVTVVSYRGQYTGPTYLSQGGTNLPIGAGISSGKLTGGCSDAQCP